MSLRNLIDERRSVLVAGRRFYVRRPTIATVELFIEIYGHEIAAVATLAQQLKELLDPEAVLPAFCMPGDLRMVRVLQSCVDPMDESCADVAQQLAREVMGMCDVPRIVRSLGFSTSAEAATVPTPPGPTDQHVAIVKLALKFGVTPFEVMCWPYEGLLDILDTLPLIGEGGEVQTSADPEPQPLEHDPRFMSAMRAFARPEPTN